MSVWAPCGALRIAHCTCGMHCVLHIACVVVAQATLLQVGAPLKNMVKKLYAVKKEDTLQRVGAPLTNMVKKLDAVKKEENRTRLHGSVESCIFKQEPVVYARDVISAK